MQRRRVGLATAALNRLEARVTGSQRRLQRSEYALGLRRVVSRVIAHVNVDGDETRFRPRVNGEMRFGKQHGAGDTLRLELEKAVADNRQSRLIDGRAAQL